MTTENQDNNTQAAKDKMLALFDDILQHDGFGEIKVEVKILKRKQKEVIIHYGKQYRFVVDAPQQA
ncbi:MAG: hypothetical protein RQ783_09430 [Gammaproteobacteria bacterium]|nr:hypothetical protein [Gammaproteobacteria bacterium]